MVFAPHGRILSVETFPIKANDYTTKGVGSTEKCFLLLNLTMANLFIILKAIDIWRIPVEGREESRILDHVEWGYWALLEQGICFLNHKAIPRPAMELFDFANHKIKRIPRLKRKRTLR